MTSEFPNELNEMEQQLYEAIREVSDVDSSLDVSSLLAAADAWKSSNELPPHIRDSRAVLKRIQANCKSDEKREGLENGPNVFGRLIVMQRKRMGLAREALATRAQIDQDELLRIESDSEYEPKPRTVRQLAVFFKISPQSMVRLANLKRQNDEQFVHQAVAFAACAKDMEKLTSQQKVALKEFVKLLNSGE